MAETTAGVILLGEWCDPPPPLGARPWLDAIAADVRPALLLWGAGGACNASYASLAGLSRRGCSLDDAWQALCAGEPKDLYAQIAAPALAHKVQCHPQGAPLGLVFSIMRVPVWDDGRLAGALLTMTAQDDAASLAAQRDRAQRLLHDVVGAMPGLVYVKDRQGRMLVANQGTSDLIGKPPAAYLGRTDAEFLDNADEARAVMETDARIMASEQGEMLEEVVSFPDGRRAVWLSTKAPMRDADGTVIGLIGSSVDISERKAAQLALAAARQRLEFALEAGGRIGTWDWVADSEVVMADARFAHLHGCTTTSGSELAADAILANIHPDDRDRVAGAVITALQNRSAFESEYRTIDGAGRERWLLARGRLLTDEGADSAANNTAPVRISGVTIDITDRRDAAERLRRAEALYRTVFERAGVGVALVSTAGPFIEINDRYCAILGRPREVIMASGWEALTHPDDLAADQAQVARLLSGAAGSFTMEKRYLATDGGDIWVNLTVGLVRDAANLPDFFIAVVEDISRRKAAEAALAGLVAEKEVLLYEVNHRVKNNLQMITSLLALQIGQLPDGDARRHLAETQARIGVVAAIHKSLYDTSAHDRIEMTQFLRNLVGGMLASMADRVTLDFQAHTAALVLPLRQAVPVSLIISELVTNALKYAWPDGRAGALVISIGQSDGMAQLVVADDGIGLPEGAAPDRPSGVGTRVIAALSRQLRGTLRFERPGAGARILLSLPVDDMTGTSGVAMG